MAYRKSVWDWQAERLFRGLAAQCTAPASPFVSGLALAGLLCLLGMQPATAQPAIPAPTPKTALVAPAPSNANLPSISNLIESQEAELPRDGAYVAGDDMGFIIDHQNGGTQLRFEGEDEIFELKVDRGPVGGRVLKYDTGDTALAVTGWGGVTVYTPQMPSGLPAERSGDAPHLAPATPNVDEMRHLASAWAQRLQQGLALTVHFDTDWQKQLNDGTTRRRVADAMLNTERAFARVKDNPAARSKAAQVETVRIGEATKAGANSKQGVLTVTVASGPGLIGAPSSLAIARALAQR